MGKDFAETKSGTRAAKRLIDAAGGMLVVPLPLPQAVVPHPWAAIGLPALIQLVYGCLTMARQQLVGTLKHTPCPVLCPAIEAAAEQRKRAVDLSAGAVSELRAH